MNVIQQCIELHKFRSWVRSIPSKDYRLESIQKTYQESLKERQEGFSWEGESEDESNITLTEKKLEIINAEIERRHRKKHERQLSNLGH